MQPNEGGSRWNDYLGMDVHAESCSFCVLSASGKVVRRDVLKPTTVSNAFAAAQNLRESPLTRGL